MFTAVCAIVLGTAFVLHHAAITSQVSWLRQAARFEMTVLLILLITSIAKMRLASWFGPFRQFVLAHPWDVEGLGNIHPVVGAAVGMWESLLSDFQGLWEGWENSFIVFPCFP
jgi:hypothetical protein